MHTQLLAARLRAERALTSPLSYALTVTPGTQAYPHIVYLDRFIMRLILGYYPVDRACISLPPRHGKSFLISDHLPAFALSRWHPYGIRIGLASYEADFAASWGRKIRTHLLEHPDITPDPDSPIRLDPASSASHRFNLLPSPGAPSSSPASLLTAGVGGPLTGFGFHLLIIDDPIKNAESVSSPLLRDRQYDWLHSTALSRLEPPLCTNEPLPFTPSPTSLAARRIANCPNAANHPPYPTVHPHGTLIIATRWHEDDLIGRLRAHEPNDWIFLNLPALAAPTPDQPDPLGRSPGEALCPARYPADVLRRLQNNPSTGPYWFSALYQGSPTPPGGGLFHPPPPPPPEQKQKAPEALSVYATVDLAASTSDRADYSVFCLFGITGPPDTRAEQGETAPPSRLVLLDLHRTRIEAEDHYSWLHRIYHSLPLDRRPRAIFIEQISFGTSLLRRAARAGLPVRPVRPTRDKITRAEPLRLLFQEQRVALLPADHPLSADLRHELEAFPNGAHDDMVDTLAYAAELWLSYQLAPPGAPRPAPPSTLEERLAAHLRRLTRPARTHPLLGRLP